MLPPDDGSENRFNGTFTDTQLTVNYFEGTLRLDDGSSYQWVVRNDGLLNGSFSQVLKTLIEVSRKDLDQAFESLGYRIDECQEIASHKGYGSSSPQVVWKDYYIMHRWRDEPAEVQKQ
jgi:hypothetical protein